MSILTLTTDWGLRDHYVASFKGGLLSLDKEMKIVDISHDIEKYNLLQASYMIRNVYPNFPLKTIHFIGLTGNNEAESDEPYVAIECNGHFFVGIDSGLFPLILGEEEKTIVRLPLSFKDGRESVHRRLTEILFRLTKGESILSLGTKTDDIIQSYLAIPTVDSQTIRATIIYIDYFGNAMVNVNRELFEQARRDRPFTIYMRKSVYNISRISNTYEDAEAGEIIGFFNEDGYLEIALNRSSATQLLGLKVMDTVRIEFGD